MPRVAFITNMPVPHQVDLFDGLARDTRFQFRVFYTRHISYGRYWRVPNTLNHDHIFIKEVRIRKHLYLNPGFFTLLREFKPDIIVVGQYSSIAYQIAMYYASTQKIPWVFWAEAPFVQYAEYPIVRSRLLRKLGQKLALLIVLKRATQIWAIGSKAQQIYFSLTPHAKVLNVPYYSDLEPFLEIPRFPLENHLVRFLFSGSLSYRKGFDLVCQASRILQEEDLPFEVHIAGAGPLKSLMRATPNMAYHGFLQPGADLINLYEMCDVLLFPTRYDGWGLVAVEAMAAGMPVISSNMATSSLDVIEEGKTGFLVESNDSSALAQRMLRYIENPALVWEMGRQARPVAECYSIDHGTKTMVDLVDQLVG